MLEIARRVGLFKLKEIWFADHPYDVDGCDSVVFYGCLNRLDADGFVREQSETIMVDLTLSEDTLFKQLSEGQYRKPIHRAERAGISVKIGCDGEFYSLYDAVRQERHLGKGIPWNTIKNHATVFLAYLDGRAISGHGYLEDRENICSWVAGSRRFEGDKAFATTVANASKLIVWSAIHYAKAKGIKRLDMGGYYGGTDNEDYRKLTIFKESVGGSVVTKYSYRKDYSPLFRAAREVKKHL